MKRIKFFVFLFIIISPLLKAQNLMEFQKDSKKKQSQKKEDLNKSIKFIEIDTFKSVNNNEILKDLSVNNVLKNYKILENQYKADSTALKKANSIIESHFKTYKNESGTERNTIDSLMFLTYKDVGFIFDNLDTLRSTLSEFNFYLKKVKNFSLSDTLGSEVNYLNKTLEYLNKKFELKSKEIKDSLEKKTSTSFKVIEEATNSQKVQSKFFSSIPQISNLFGNGGFIIPNISILGSQNFERGAVSGNLRLLSSGVKPSKNDDWRSLPIIENTVFGIQTNLIKGIYSRDANYNKVGGMKNLGFQSSLSYLLKNGIDSVRHSTDTSSLAQKNYNYGLAHLSIGLRYVAIKNLIEIYADYNYQDILTGQNPIKTGNLILYENRNRMGFFNTGFQAKISADRFAIKELASNYVLFDLNFIWSNAFLRNIASSSKALIQEKTLVDKVLIVLKVSLKI